jgi:hypothetical protein
MNLKCIALATLAVMSFSDGATAQSGQVNLQYQFAGTIDCDQPRRISNFPISGRGSGVLFADRRASLDLTITGSSSNRIRFAPTLGGQPISAPGGTAQLRVASGNRLRMTWVLPNNEFIVDVAAAKSTCTLKIETRLRGGGRQYSLFDGGQFYFCSKPRITQTSCSIR